MIFFICIGHKCKVALLFYKCGFKLRPFIDYTNTLNCRLFLWLVKFPFMGNSTSKHVFMIIIEICIILTDTNTIEQGRCNIIVQVQVKQWHHWGRSSLLVLCNIDVLIKQYWERTSPGCWHHAMNDKLATFIILKTNRPATQ